MDSLALSLNTAVSGLQAAQANLSLISANIANAQTAGYTAQYYDQTAELIDGEGAGVSTGVALTNSDPILQASLNSQQSTTSAASTLNSYYQQIQNLFGQAGSAQTLGDNVNSLASALQTLATSPNDTVAQQNVVTAAQQLTSQLNSTSAGIQSIRTDADNGIGNAVTQVNTLLSQIATYNSEIEHATAFNQSTATLEDQRNEAMQQLSQQLNVTSYTTSGDAMVVLLGGQTLVSSSSAQQLSFTPAGTLSAATPTSGITLNGLNVTSEITGGNIGALLQMRDQVLPSMTQELNQLATQLYNTGQVATSQTQTISGTAAAGDVLTGNIEGVAFTTAALTAGTSTAIAAAIQAQFTNYPNIQVTATGANTIEITDAAGNAMSSSIQLTSGTGNETFLASPAANPSSPIQVMSTQTQTMSGTPVVGDTFTTTIDGTTVTTAAIGAVTTTAIAAAIQAALPGSLSSHIQVTATGSGTIQVTDTQGNPLSSTIAVATGTGTETFSAGAPNNPLPTTNSGLSGAAPGDAYHLFSNVNASNSDNAGTIEVNPDLVADPSLLDGSSIASPGIAAALANSIQNSAPTFPATGNFSSPLTMTLNQYAGQIVGQNSTAAANASNNSQYQTGVQNQISTSLQNETGVNMDTQLSNLTIYQNSYAASARVVQVVDDMFNSLMQIQP